MSAEGPISHPKKCPQRPRGASWARSGTERSLNQGTRVMGTAATWHGSEARKVVGTQRFTAQLFPWGPWALLSVLAFSSVSLACLPPQFHPLSRPSPCTPACKQPPPSLPLVHRVSSPRMFACVSRLRCLQKAALLVEGSETDSEGPSSFSTAPLPNAKVGKKRSQAPSETRCGLGAEMAWEPTPHTLCPAQGDGGRPGPQQHCQCLCRPEGGHLRGP